MNIPIDKRTVTAIKNEPVEIKVTAEEQQEIFTGRRPEGMDYEVYRKVRKDLHKAHKMYRKGKFFFISKNLDPMFDEKLGVGRIGRTYVKKHDKKAK